VQTEFSKADRLQLVLRAIERECSLVELVGRGYVVDAIPLPSSARGDDQGGDDHALLHWTPRWLKPGEERTGIGPAGVSTR